MKFLQINVMGYLELVDILEQVSVIQHHKSTAIIIGRLDGQQWLIQSDDTVDTHLSSTLDPQVFNERSSCLAVITVSRDTVEYRH